MRKASMYAALVLLAAVSVVPFLWMLATSFKHGQDIYSKVPSLLPLDRKTGEWAATLGNYDYVLGVGGLGGAFVNSVWVCAVLVPAKLLIDALAAYAFARIPFPGRDRLFVIMLGGMMVPAITLLVPRIHVTQSLGMFDTGWGLIVPNIASVLDIFLMRQFFLSLPAELEEAALIDGAGRMRIFWTIVLPLSKPVLAVVTITSFLFHWNDLVWPLLVTNDPELYTLPLALQQLVASPDGGRAYYIMAGATLAVLPVIAVLLVFQRRILAGIAFTGLKG
ncbi:carbohydrate ABC transporter permease [Nonomuraea fuscirosea]|jgi:multiple sugar transport system permease protein|uniref:Carbohydrate ABC transporter membrane protein 2 (CUT1 family) n=1 Tax=Nonomuraea fuscirosea TaxID=1291556 RepID=A0A2T0MNU0_9ACTN|nr:carbohydrate ABC transporter permease [Nonomuraea fuscirosea]PRX59654.1 carbohydrate ABC transporter membrane protein 2 (CUT1 family) [Nonomuraea fuscirosea]WSA55201.1 carbohydrate ABC transporter permease [Nonomuraea fuscirosea]